jgi:dTDP-4-dehydrorhamnose 3,5-epimerase-like enzyme
MSASVIFGDDVSLSTRIEELPIKGLHWRSRWRMNNGQPDSFVVPFPTNYSANLVYHGHTEFDYGHYGIHLGQEDRLTFLGPQAKTIRADFIDCRDGSPTLHTRFSMEFAPGSARTLYIPPGVAHTFYGLEAVHTINEYGLFLPDPELWASRQSAWQPGNDIVNIPLDIRDEDLPTFQANAHPASSEFYAVMAGRQKQAIPKLTTEFPMAQDMVVDGKSVRVALKARLKVSETIPEWEPVGEIAGVGWQRHLNVVTGEHSGIVPIPGPQVFYVVDHGELTYAHDSYGIHLGQQDRLTFVGPADHEVTVNMLDCRAGSPTLHRTMSHVFRPSPRRFLVIPPGVAHGFVGLEKVYTINRPGAFTKADGSYKPGTDVIDWPMDRTPLPVLTPYPRPAEDSFYHRQAAAQIQLSMEKVTHDTPKVQIVTDPKTGKQHRVVLRRRREEQAEPPPVIPRPNN